MRLLHVLATLSAEWGGPPKAAVDMARALAERGHEVTILAGDEGDPPVDLDTARAAGVEIATFPLAFPRRFMHAPGLGRALAAAVPRADLVHVHSLYLYHSWVAGRLSRRHGVPFVLSPHGSLDPYLYRRHRGRKWVVERLFQNALMGAAAALYFITEEERDLARPVSCGAKGVVVPLGLHAADYAELPPKGRFRAAHPEIGDRLILLFFGRLNFKKGLDLLVPAFARARARGVDAHLVLAGPDDNMADKVRGWLDAADLAAHATFTGRLAGADSLALLADADIFVLSSYTENFGIAVVEAMACGLPVLISDRVNIWREVAAAGAGRVEPCDAERFGDAIVEMFADPDALARMGAGGWRCARDEFDWARIAARMEETYAALIKP
ncbi:MAG: glycosyltransferase [Alphaproteobacteria bacterium]